MFRCRDGLCVLGEVHCDFTSQSKLSVFYFIVEIKSVGRPSTAAQQPNFFNFKLSNSLY